MNTNFYFTLFSNCIPVKGAVRSIICDLQRGSYLFISNDIVDVLTSCETMPIFKILDYYRNINEVELEILFNQLIELNLGHYCENPDRFPKINTQFNSPYEILDCIIELSDCNLKYIDNIFESLTILGCQTIEFRTYSHFSLEKIEIFLSKLNLTRIRNVELIVCHSQLETSNAFEAILKKYPIIETLVIHSADIDNCKTIGASNLIFTTQIITSSSCCGNISKEDFKINLPFYLHGIKNNTCLYKKISIKANGDITNCPSLEKTFGSVIELSLEQALNTTGFKELWSIKKDDINICKVCEFRYICSDCRAFLNDVYEKPFKCSYDPYSPSFHNLS